MIKLLEAYSLSEIFIFLFLVIFAVKELSSIFDWGKGIFQRGVNKNVKDIQDKQNVNERLDKIEKVFEVKEEKFNFKKQEIEDRLTNVDSSLKTLQDSIDLLLASDKESIKSFIVKEHHYFCYKVGWIDDYSIDCIERRYEKYVKEKGNSFIAELMEEIRALPKQPPVTIMVNNEKE